MLARALVMLELAGGCLGDEDQKLLRFALGVASSVDVLAVNCELEAVSVLEGVVGVYVVATRSPISQRANSAALAMVLSGLCSEHDVVMASELSWQHAVLCRAGAVLNRAVVACVYASTGDGEFIRSVSAGRLAQRVACTTRKPWLVSFRSLSVRGGLAPLPPPAAVSLRVLDCSAQLKLEVASWAKSASKSEAVSLATALVVVAGGRSFATAEAFDQHVVALASKLNAGVGATRAAVDAGVAPPECQIGQTGLVISPKVYVALGISGSSQHMVGVRGAGIIVAVN